MKDNFKFFTGFQTDIRFVDGFRYLGFGEILREPVTNQEFRVSFYKDLQSGVIIQGPIIHNDDAFWNEPVYITEEHETI